MKDFVHTYRFPLNLIIQDIAEHIPILSPTEKGRAKRFLYSADMNRYLAAHIFLRKILSRYTICAPSHIKFILSPLYNKPLLDTFIHPDLYFNLSYRDEWGLLIISDMLVGADIEKHIQINNIEEFTLDFYSIKEINWLYAFQSLESKKEAFFTLWTLKEAYIKAIGKGLSYPLDSFSILIDAKKSIEIEIPGEPEQANVWNFIKLEAPHNYSAAIAFKKKNASTDVAVESFVLSGIKGEMNN